MVADAPVDKPDDERDDRYEAQAAVLTDRWTAAGLAALLRGPFVHLAQAAGSAPTPLLALVEAMASQHLETYGDAFAPLPPAPLPDSPEEQAALLRSAPLPQLLARAAADPQGADEQTRELALASGFLVREQGGALSAGPLAEAWREGGPAELTGLASGGRGGPPGRPSATGWTRRAPTDGPLCSRRSPPSAPRQSPRGGGRCSPLWTRWPYPTRTPKFGDPFAKSRSLSSTVSVPPNAGLRVSMVRNTRRPSEQ
ncbi:hypothetical protein ACIF8W_10415 [Streptomyces sp. NPDC085639]|uniref:hypothetical protein n=1 Tax=Streptomyces sp. NPDC085639 TaxID=3365734 RepID=UPI0037D443D3